MAESTQTLRVADVMQEKVHTVHPSTPVGKVFETMEKHHITSVPVIEGDECVGMVTATDLVRLIRETNAALRSGYPHYEDCLWAVDLAHRKLDQQPVREIMAVGVETVSPEEPLCDAAKRLASCGRHRLVVVSDGKLVGFLSALDIAAAIC